MDFCRRVLVPLFWTYFVSINVFFAIQATTTTTTTTLYKCRVSFTQRQEMFWIRLRLDLDLTLLEAEYTEVVADRVDSGCLSRIHAEQSGDQHAVDRNTGGGKALIYPVFCVLSCTISRRRCLCCYHSNPCKWAVAVSFLWTGVPDIS